MLSSRLRLGLPRGLFPSDFPTKNFVLISHISHVCYMPYHLTLLDPIAVIIRAQ